MSRFRKLSHAIWHCQYHVVWVPNYRYRILGGAVAYAVERCIRVFKKFPKLKVRPYWGNDFWAPGYCVDTIGLDEEQIRRYVQYQERREKHEEQGKLFR